MASPFDSQYDNVRSRIEYYANLYGIPVNVAIWQLWQENRFRNTGCSNQGACGIAQFIPATAARFGVDRDNIESSLNGWGKYMQWLLGRSYINGDIRLALAGYNAGEGRVQQYGGIPPFAETQNYVSTIMANAENSGYVPVTGGGSSSVSSLLGGSNTIYYMFGFLVLVLLIDD